MCRYVAAVGVMVIVTGGELWKSSRYLEQQILCQPTALNAMFADSVPIFPLCVSLCVFGQQAVVPMVVCY